MVKNTAKIFDIQRFCLFDGDGIRTTVFFKGCPLRCEWCCNPESQKFEPELLIKQSPECANCKKCLEICEKGAVTLTDKGISVDMQKCGYCGKCEDLCAFNRLKVAGREYTVDDILAVIMKDKDYYDDSNGGVTLSGGEVCAQGEFVIELIERLKKENINVMIETCGYANSDTMKKIASLVDRIYFDIKLMDEKQHEKYTGQSNALIKENLKLVSSLCEVIVRIPIIPDVNMNDEFIRDFAEFIEPLDVKCVELLPYHRLGVGKYAELSREYPLKDTKVASREENMYVLNSLKALTTKEIKFRA